MKSDCSIELKKTKHGFFNIAIRKVRFSNGSHFQWPAAIENGGTSVYRAQPAEKHGFSTACLFKRRFDLEEE
jgi:hypothetical protein